jgi:Na+/proline symporter
MTQTIQRLRLPLAVCLLLALYAGWLLWGSTDSWERYWLGNLSILVGGTAATAMAGWCGSGSVP